MAEAPPYFAYLEELRALQGEPRVTYPTGDRSYPVLERLRTLYNKDIPPLLPGQPEPNAELYPRHFLVGLDIRKSNETQSEVYLRYESAPGYPSGQNAWSFELNYVSQGLNHPIYIRQTTEPRLGYVSLLVPAHTPATPAKAFTGITEIRVTAPGSGYRARPGVEIVGGAGTGAAAVAHIVGEKLVRVELTAHGWGYTTPITVTIGGGGGTGATATGHIQPASAVLVSEETRPAPGDLARDFIVVSRTWKTLPGPVLTGQKLDQRTGLTLEVFRQEVFAGEEIGAVPAGTVSVEIDPVSVVESLKTSSRYLGSSVTSGSPPLTWRMVDSDWDDTIQGDIWEVEVEVPVGTAAPEVGDLFEGRFIIDRKFKRLNGSFNLYTLWTVAQPADWTEAPEGGEQFPALFDFLMEGPFTVEKLSDFNRPGVVYNYLAHRTDSYTQRIVHSFLNIPSGVPDLSGLPPVFHVLTPAAGSRVFPINANTIHPAFSIADSNGMLEIFPASSPANYNPADTLFRGASCNLWRGKMYHIILRFSCENGFVNPPGTGDPGTGSGIPMIREVIIAESDDGGIAKLSAKSRLVYDGEPGDIFVVCGTADGAAAVETVVIGAYGPVRGDARFNLLESVYINSGGISYDPRVRATGTNGDYRFDFFDPPTPGDTWLFQASDAQYAPPTSFGYALMADGGAIVVTGGATTGASLLPLDGIYAPTLPLVNGYPKYVSNGGGELFHNPGVPSWTLRHTFDPPHYFSGGNDLAPESSGGAYMGLGTTAGTPVLTRDFVFNPATPGHVLLGSTLLETMHHMAAAINLTPAGTGVGAGIEYGNGTLANPFFGSAEPHATADRLLMTGFVAHNHALAYVGTADGVVTIANDPSNGTVLVHEDAGTESTHYNSSSLWNPNFRLNVPPGLADAPALEIDLLQERTVTIHYRMQAEVTVKYQTWDAVAESYNAPVTLETVGGDTDAVLPIGDTQKVQFLISNSSPTQAKRANLYLSYFI